MIQTMDDARRWRESVKLVASLVDRLARLYWSDEEEFGSQTLAETLYRDNKFRPLEAVDLQEHAKRVLDNLDDLAVLVIFSVFEARVRGAALTELERIEPDIPGHPVLTKAAEEAKRRVKDGSFGHLTESYKTSDPNLKGEVDQVRQYRNWVAHGRRDRPAQNVTPEAAEARLQRFLELLEPEDEPG